MAVRPSTDPFKDTTSKPDFPTKLILINDPCGPMDIAQRLFLLRGQRMDVFQLAKLNDAIAILGGLASSKLTFDVVSPSSANRRVSYVDAAIRESEARKRRAAIFEGLEIRDAGWDILIELFIMKSRGIRLSVSDIGREAEIPSATVVRWLALFEQYHFITRDIDAHDRRRTWISLTKLAKSKMEQYFSNTVVPNIANVA